MPSLTVKYSFTFEDLDKKFRTLKSQIRRECKKLTVSNKSGMSPKTCAWFGYGPLMFLLPLTESRGSRNTATEQRVDVSEINLF